MMHRANDAPIVSVASALGVGSPRHSTISTEFGSLRMLSMSAYSSSEFTTAEKVELLVNVLQSLVQDLPQYLFHLIHQQQRQPPWNDIPLPRGRSLHACQIAFEEMRRTMPLQPGSMRSASTSQYVHIAPAVTSTRSVSDHDLYPPAQRLLQPRPSSFRTDSPVPPPVTNGESPTLPRHPPLEPLSALKGERKRGRPTKEEAERRDREYAAQGKIYQPKRKHKKPRASLGPEAEEMKDEESPFPQTRTPTAMVSDMLGETSSGKRRRRQIRDQSPIPFSAGADPRPRIAQAEPEQEPETNVAESPSDRLLAGNRDRDRDRTSIGSSLSRPTQHESDTTERLHTSMESELPT